VRVRWLSLVLVCGATLIGGPAYADPGAPAERTTVEGHVVAFELGDIVVDVAADQGAQTGTELELWRPLSLKHPVTGQVVSDRFLIGRLRLTQVRGALALARPVGKLEHPAQAGDVVVLRRAPAKASKESPTVVPAPPAPAATELQKAPPKPEVTTAAQTAEASSESPDDENEARIVSRLFDRLRGASVQARVLAYEGYVKRRPHGKYAVVLYEEAAQLRRLVTLESGPQGERAQAVSFEPPREARSAAPLTIALELGRSPVGAVLHSRNAGEVAYRTTPMTRVGEGYYSADIEPSRLNAPRFEYFIEAVRADGSSVPAVATPEEPLLIKVEDVPTPKAPPRPPATFMVSTDYADWNNWKHNDVVWQTEGSVGMRFRDVGLRAARTGFGVYRGRGGSLEDLDVRQLGGRSVGLTYGYLEGEYGVSNFTGLIGRVVIGLEDKGVTGGAQALLRLGNDRDTNLVIGGEILGGIGLRGITELQLATFPNVPILFRTEVTNQPAGFSAVETTSIVQPAGTPTTPANPADVSLNQGQVGARAIAQVGYRFLPDLVVSVRGSYQGRTINHAGPGVGGAVAYQW
jgi:hypothetical protein